MLKAVGAAIILDHPTGFLLHASGKGAPTVLNWAPNWMSDLLSHIIHLSPGSFIDAGANVGQTMLSYKMNAGESYIGIEPNPVCAGFVDEMIQLNKLTAYRVISVGLSDNNGIAQLYSSYSTDTGSTMVTNIRNLDGLREQFVAAWTLGSIVGQIWT